VRAVDRCVVVVERMRKQMQVSCRYGESCCGPGLVVRRARDVLLIAAPPVHAPLSDWPARLPAHLPQHTRHTAHLLCLLCPTVTHVSKDRPSKLHPPKQKQQS
jgi:hypothetical protein